MMQKFILCLILFFPWFLMAQVPFEAEYLDPEIIDQSLKQIDQLKAELDNVELMEDGSYVLDLNSAPIMAGITFFYRVDGGFLNRPMNRVIELDETARRLTHFRDELTTIFKDTPWNKTDSVRIYFNFTYFDNAIDIEDSPIHSGSFNPNAAMDITEFSPNDSSIVLNDGTRDIKISFSDLKNPERLRALNLSPQMINKLNEAVDKLQLGGLDSNLGALDELRASRSSRESSSIRKWLSNTFGGRASVFTFFAAAGAFAYFTLSADEAEAAPVQEEASNSNIIFHTQFTEESLQKFIEDIDFTEENFINLRRQHVSDNAIGF